METYDFVIVGGGFFGSYLASSLKERMPKLRVLLIEQENALLKRASYNNQARIHQGYHYPRSLLTALRSHKNFQRFVKEFRPCVVDDFEKYYAVAKLQSKVTASQFDTFCRRIGMPICPAPKQVKDIFNPRLIEEVYSVQEFAFNAAKLAKMMKARLKAAGVDVMLNTSVLSVQRGRPLHVEMRRSRKRVSVAAGKVFLCSYANINDILHRSGIELLDLKYEMTEMALVSIPKELQGKSVTVMCGPFFAFLPFPDKGLYTLSHVRYTPHHEWRHADGYVDNQEYYERARKSMKTNFPKMVKDVQRYIPLAEKFKYRGSIWELKAILPVSEYDDSRPILFKKDVGGVRGLYCILGGKIDNAFDMDEEIGRIIRSKR
jgi:glycine/D-amino acid oxidase-like deaminating enzyme